MYLFSTDCWSIDCLSRLLKAQPSVVRKHIGFWVSQGLLKEQSTDVYAVVQEQKLAHKGIMTRECCTIHYVSRLRI